MTRETVKSSSIKELGYDLGTQVLEVQFASGQTYRYLDVPPSEYEALRRSPSMGAHVGRHIKPNYKCEKVRTDDEPVQGLLGSTTGS
jgi:hypothetical protein